MNANEVVQLIPDKIKYICNMDGKSMIITGSYLLSMLGLTSTYDDIDILITGVTKSEWNDIYNESWKEDSDVLDFEGTDYGDSDCFKITKGSITFNFILENDYGSNWEIFSRDAVTEHVYLDTLEHALSKKIGLNREKDKEVLNLIKTKLEKLWRIQEKK